MLVNLLVLFVVDLFEVYVLVVFVFVVMLFRYGFWKMLVIVRVSLWFLVLLISFMVVILLLLSLKKLFGLLMEFCGRFNNVFYNVRSVVLCEVFCGFCDGIVWKELVLDDVCLLLGMFLGFRFLVVEWCEMVRFRVVIDFVVWEMNVLRMLVMVCVIFLVCLVVM